METKKKGNIGRKRKRKNSFKNLPKPIKVRVTNNADLTPEEQQVQQSTSGDQQQQRTSKIQKIVLE